MQAGDLGLGRVDGRGENVRDLLLLRLGARGQRGLGAEAVDETLEVRDFPLLVFQADSCCASWASRWRIEFVRSCRSSARDVRGAVRARRCTGH